MALNPFQQAVSDLAKSLGLRGQAEQQVYQTPQYQELLLRQLGNIPLPAGVDESMVISRTPQAVEYRDAEGFVHRLERNLDARDRARFGQVTETSTNRPAILPLAAQNPNGVLQLDPATQAQLKQIFDAQNAIQEDQFQKAQGTNIAQLVGRGIGASSIAGQITNQLLQGQSLARGQQQALQNQAMIDLQKFLLGLGTQRDIAGGQLTLQGQQLNQQNRQFYDQLFQQQLVLEEQQRQMERQAMWNNIFKGIATATGIASGLGGLNFGSLFGGSKSSTTFGGDTGNMG
jgi:hypothetical protein